MMTLANVYYININNYFTVEFKNEMQRKLYKLLPPHKSVARLLFWLYCCSQKKYMHKMSSLQSALKSGVILAAD